MTTNLHTLAPAARTLAIPPAYRDSVATDGAGGQEYLPFTVRQISSPEDLARAIDLRHLAYARHMPEFAQALKTPEQDDLVKGVMVLIAESKLDGSVIGTVRIQTNVEAPLNMEQSLALPTRFSGQTIAEVRRLAVAPGTSGRLVKMALLKAVYLYCVTQDLDWILVAARSPLDRMYEQLTLEDVLDGGTFIPLPRDNNVAHRVLGARIAELPARFTAVGHPLHDFFFVMQHPDIVGSDPDLGAFGSPPDVAGVMQTRHARPVIAS